MSASTNNSSLNFKASLSCFIVIAFGKLAIFPFSSLVIKAALTLDCFSNSLKLLQNSMLKKMQTDRMPEN